MKTQKEHISKMQEKVQEIRLAQEQVELAEPDYKKAKKMSIDLYSKMVDLKGFASKSGDTKLADILKQMDKAHSALSVYLDSKG